MFADVSKERKKRLNISSICVSRLSVS